MHHFKNLGAIIVRDRDLEKTAVIDIGGESGPKIVSYAKLDAVADAVANGLQHRNLARGSRIAILSANNWEYLATYFGIMRAGHVAVPVNFKYSRNMVGFILSDADVVFVFCDKQRRGICPSDLPLVVFGDDFRDGFAAFIRPGAFDALDPGPGAPAMFLYTSGSSGVPKGVILSHESHIWVAQTRLGSQNLERHRYLVSTPLYHMNALALAKLACVGHATIVLLPEFEVRNYISAIEEWRITIMTAVPPMLAMMLREPALLARTDLSSVEIIRLGAAPVSRGLMAAIKELCPRAEVVNAYGTTEAGPVVFAAHPRGLAQPEMALGFPHPQVELRLVDRESGDGDQGELEIKSPALLTGYHNRPDLLQPMSEDGFYRTGDVFRRDTDGFFFFVGRVDDMFVSGGRNIFPAEVERVLEAHPAIAQACVVPVPDEIKGTKPVAFVILRPGQSLCEEEIKSFALENAPAYQHPRSAWIVDALPLATTNKIDRKALIRMAAENVRCRDAVDVLARERMVRVRI